MPTAPGPASAKEKLRQIFDAMKQAEAAHKALSPLSPFNLLTPNEQFEADLEFRASQFRVWEAQRKYEEAARQFIESQP